MTIFLLAAVHAETYLRESEWVGFQPGHGSGTFQDHQQSACFHRHGAGRRHGQVVEVAGGTYNESLMFNLPSGLS